ncbi:hypothetical protein FH972_005983 [Carpinus fangiana]|uniref:Cytochrome P450 n=1 Tax=Carpinus fangiana TaxID=176857 RepID=A0A5N6QUF1_9ROSI|nr:hypothetical protein FH972_005983 [Carpinus fangiana]
MALPSLPFLQQYSWQELNKIPFINPLLSLLFFISFLYAFKRIRSGKPNLPPSPPKLPIIGNLHQLGTLPYRSLHALSNKYGPLMFLNLGHTPTLVVSSGDMAREMLKTHDVVFSNRPKITAANALLYGCTDVGFSPYGEYWRQARRICVLELLSLKRVQSFQYVREEEIEVLMKKIRKSCSKGNSVDLSKMLMATSNNIVSRCVLGKTFEEEEGKSTFEHLSRRIMVHLGAFCFGDFFPFLGWIDVLTGFIPSLKATFRELDALFDQAIEEHKTFETDDDERKDLDMFVGGTDTTSTTLEWLMAELIKHPNVMKRAQEEVRRVVGKKSKIDVNDINQMHYLKCILKETLRLHPPVPLSVPRETSTSVKFRGYDIPQKTRVFLNIWAIQRDPTLWERPEEFLPERFKDTAVDFNRQEFEFIPFGGGRRRCPGLTFGVASIEYVTANILYWFDWRLPSGSAREKDLDMSEVNGLTVSKKIPLFLVPTLHSP